MRKLSLAVATLAAPSLILAGCADGITTPLVPDPGERLAAMAKVNVCHVDEEGIYRLIRVAEVAYDSHVAHGDKSPGDLVPGMDGYRFGPDCTPEPILAASGDVIWTSAPGVAGHHTVFEVFYDNSGTVTHYHPEGDLFVIDVSCVSVIGDEVWFGGTVTEATGRYEDRIGLEPLFWARDNSVGPDRIGTWIAMSCAQAGVWRGGGTVTDGDLTVY